MKKLIILLTLLTLVFVVGCSDDDETPTNPAVVTPEGFVHGSLYLDPEASIDEMMIIGYGAIPPNIDSIKVGDSLFNNDDALDYDYDEEYHENWWIVYFDEDGSNYMYEHGDMATMSFYGEGKSSSVSFTVLDADIAEVEILSPLYNADTLTAAAPLTITWDSKEFVEYYSVWLEYVVGDNWEDVYHYTYTADTTFTITADMFPDSLRYMYVNVTPFTGPNPITDVGNVTGNFLTGKVFSFGWYDYTRIQGWYNPTAANPKLVPKANVHPNQIIENTYKFAK